MLGIEQHTSAFVKLTEHPFDDARGLTFLTSHCKDDEQAV